MALSRTERDAINDLINSILKFYKGFSGIPYPMCPSFEEVAKLVNNIPAIDYVKGWDE